MKLRIRSILLLVALVAILAPMPARPTAAQSSADGLPAITLTVEGVVRAWPLNNAEIVGRLPALTTVPASGRLVDSTWWAIPYPGGPDGTAWISAAGVTPNAAAAGVPTFVLEEPAAPPPPPPPVPTPLAVAPTPATACTYNSAFVADLSIPDGTAIGPAQSFNKVWRLRNTGTCPWPGSTSLAFVGGVRMSAPPQVNVPAAAPGAIVDVGVTLFGPSAPGKYSGVWQLLSPDGQPFGGKYTVVVTVPGAPPPAPTPVPPPQAPQSGSARINFWSDTDRVNGGNCTTLHWDVEGVQAIYLDYNGKTRGVTGHESKSVCPASDGKTYTLRAALRDGSQQSRQLQINVDNPPNRNPKPDIAFQADRTKINFGECVHINWGVNYASRVRFSDSKDWRSVNHHDETDTCPYKTINLRLEVKDLDGQTHERSIRVEVKGEPPPGYAD